MEFKGIWLPIITPFKDNKIDYSSYQRLINHYIDTGIHGIIPLGTTGEVPVLEDYEFEEMIEKTLEFTNNKIPICIGIGGNYTAKVIRKIKKVEHCPIAGILSVCPYYNKPSQEGVYQHFKHIAEETNHNLIVYNIPYRTGINITNETIYQLAEIKNIIGLKDASGDMKQTTSLLMNPPKDFSILTGEDILFFLNLVLGGQGGILASSHIRTEKFVEVYNKITIQNDTAAAKMIWKELSTMISLLFEETNPAPIKYLLHKDGLIDSPELRLPLTQISESLKKKLNLYHN